MSKKSYCRSFRFDEKVNKIIELQPGDNFNEKFENLVFTCYEKLPQIQAEIAFHEKILADRRVQCLNMLERVNRLDFFIRQMKSMQKKLDEFETYLNDATIH